MNAVAVCCLCHEALDCDTDRTGLAHAICSDNEMASLYEDDAYAEYLDLQPWPSVDRIARDAEVYTACRPEEEVVF